MSHIGQVFGILTVVSDAPRKKCGTWSARMVNVRCRCGTEKEVRLGFLKRGTTVSCGCLRAERAARNARAGLTTHGQSGTSLHKIWKNMLARCRNPKHTAWHNYGGRGIKVCEAWERDFSVFAAHVGQRPQGMTLDRIDVNGNYEPGNVRWATRAQQVANRRPQAEWTPRNAA